MSLFGKKREDKFIVVDCSFNCPREKCPKWVILNHSVTSEDGTVKNIPEGKCALAWLPILLVELKESLQGKQ
jgi:hypothetical protein